MADAQKRKENIAVTIALVVLAFFFIVAISVFNIFGDVFSGGQQDNAQFGSIPETGKTTNRLSESGELVTRDIKEGEGMAVEEGMILTVHYRGTFEDGTVFDSSYNRGEPFRFVLGEGSVIEGWEEGLSGMKVGGKRTLVIPPDLAYGDADYGPIPGGSTLIFDIELLGAEIPE